MSAPLLFIVAAIYVYVAAEQAWHGRYGMALAWFAYALANLGFVLDLWRK